MPTEIFENIVEFVKIEKRDITTLRMLSFTCKLLRSMLRELILNEVFKYTYEYRKLGCKFDMTTTRFHIYTSVFDGLLNYRNLNPRDGDNVAACCAAGIIGDTKLMKQLSLKCLKHNVRDIARCVGYGGDEKMFKYFKGVHVKDEFWHYCLRGAFVNDNVSCLEFCDSKCMYDIIENAVQFGCKYMLKCVNFLYYRYYYNKALVRAGYLCRKYDELPDRYILCDR